MKTLTQNGFETPVATGISILVRFFENPPLAEMPFSVSHSFALVQDLEHTGILGDTIEKIASEKGSPPPKNISSCFPAGIFKVGIFPTLNPSGFSDVRPRVFRPTGL